MPKTLSPKNSWGTIIPDISDVPKETTVLTAFIINLLEVRLFTKKVKSNELN